MAREFSPRRVMVEIFAAVVLAGLWIAWLLDEGLVVRVAAGVASLVAGALLLADAIRSAANTGASELDAALARRLAAAGGSVALLAAVALLAGLRITSLVQAGGVALVLFGVLALAYGRTLFVEGRGASERDRRQMQQRLGGVLVLAVLALLLISGAHRAGPLDELTERWLTFAVTAGAVAGSAIAVAGRLRARGARRKPQADVGADITPRASHGGSR